MRHRPKIVLEIHRDVSRADILALLESCGYLVDNEPIDDSLGAFADPQSNASFIFQANPFLSERTTPTQIARRRRLRLLSSLCSCDNSWLFSLAANSPGPVHLSRKPGLRSCGVERY